MQDQFSNDGLSPEEADARHAQLAALEAQRVAVVSEVADLRVALALATAERDAALATLGAHPGEGVPVPAALLALLIKKLDEKKTQNERR